MQSNLKKYLFDVLIIVGFAVFALIYCYPSLQGKVLTAGDNVSWKAMAQEGKQWHEKTGENVMWSNSMFGGMPTYTYYVPESNNFIYKIQDIIFSLLTKPSYFLFLAMLCFYILMRVLDVNKWVSIIGSIAFAFSTFNMGIIIAGHETEMTTIAYMPAVIAGLLLVYRAKWWSGIPLLGISLALAIANSHYQVLYYLAMLIFLMVIGLLVTAIKEGKLKQFFIASVAALVTAIVAVGPSAPSLLTTSDYAKETMRGGNSELSGHDKDKKNGGLDKDYAFLWSNAIGETISSMIPYYYGGSSDEPIEKAPKLAELTGGQASAAPMYWGPQPFLAGPVYFGAVICFLFVLGIMIVKSKHKWWIVAGAALSIVMSWGKHFAGFNYFLFDTLPMLNKFRTPTMALVLAEMLFPLLGVWALNDIVTGKVSKEELWKKLKIAAGITAGICVLLAVAGSAFFSFTNPEVDARYQPEILKVLKEDRSALAMKSAITSAVYILLAAAVIWAFIKNMIKTNVLIIGVGALVLIDLVSVANNYLNEEKYVEATDYDAQFQPRPVDQEILKDGSYYRVLDLTRNVNNDAIQAYFHKCIGGYSPAKLEIYQDLIDRQLDLSSRKINAQVLNMLNTKYIVFQGQGNQPGLQVNQNACGNAWFVNNIKWVNTADEEMDGLNAASIGDTATVPNAFDPRTTAVIRNTYKDKVGAGNIGKDSAAYVKLDQYGLNNISFVSKNSTEGLAVFSDIYYKDWHATIDGKEVPIIRANYVLRALKVPAGEHKIEFHFVSDSFEKGNKMALISSILLLGICAAGIFMSLKKGKDTPAA